MACLALAGTPAHAQMEDDQVGSAPIGGGLAAGPMAVGTSKIKKLRRRPVARVRPFTTTTRQRLRRPTTRRYRR